MPYAVPQFFHSARESWRIVLDRRSVPNDVPSRERTIGRKHGSVFGSGALARDQEQVMNEESESVAIRLWRDRAQLREQERNEVQTRLRIAEEKIAILTGENDRLAAEIARLKALAAPDAGAAQTETELQMEALKGALMSLISRPADTLTS
jgi:hypothetical protein